MLESRRHGGRLLARKLETFAGTAGVVVLALPPGGIPVADEIARALGAPLDVFLVSPLRFPGRDEPTFGAVATGGVRVLDEVLLGIHRVSPFQLQELVAHAEAELERRQRAYIGSRPPLPVQGRTVLLVGDGLTTGAAARAAVSALRSRHPERIIVAVPVAPAEVCENLRASADAVRCLMTPEPFESVARWYRSFEPVTNEEVRELLGSPRARALHSAIPL